jgi:hypothetical protein
VPQVAHADGNPLGRGARTLPRRTYLSVRGFPSLNGGGADLTPRLRHTRAQAPSEAEAQCAELCRGGLVRFSLALSPPSLFSVKIDGQEPPPSLTRTRAQVYGAGSEDMDTLTFNSPIVLRHLTFSEARKMPIDVISLDEVLAGLELTMDKVRVPGVASLCLGWLVVADQD